jgi:light-regulated signal transduction histidine kinase (bacteriophytochrome)
VVNDSGRRGSNRSRGASKSVGELPVIDAEKLQMRQLLQNLIGNALKFRRPEAPPLVKVAARNFSDEAGTGTSAS